MALTEQVTDFPLVGGVDESTRPRLCSRLLAMVNCRQVKTGSIEKRYGTSCVGAVNARLGGLGTPPQGELLTSLGREVVRIGAGQVDACIQSVGSADCSFKGRASEALLYRRSISPGDTYAANLDIACAGVFQIVTYQSYSGTSVNIVYEVIDNEGSVIIPRTVAATIASGGGSSRACVFGNYAVIAWSSQSGSTYTISMIRIDLTTMVVSGVSAIYAGSSLGAWAFAGGGSVYYFAYADSTGTHISRLDATGLLTTALVATDTYAVSTIDVAWSPTVAAYVAYIEDGGSGVGINVYARAYDQTTLSPITARTTVAAYGPSESGSYGLGIAASGSTAWVAFNSFDSSIPYSAEIARWVSFNTSAAVGTVYTSYQTLLVSKPFVANGLLYVFASNHHSTHATHFLLHLADGATPATGLNARIVAVGAPRQVPYNTPFFSKAVSSVALVASGHYVLAALVSGSIINSLVACIYDVYIGNTSPVAAEIGGLLITSGGCVSAYDGSTVAELGMAYEPDLNVATATVTSGGSMSVGVYYYLLCYEWRYANGAVVRSIPSYPYQFDGSQAIGSQGLLSVTTTSGNQSVSFRYPNLNLTNKQHTADQINAVSLVVYRTQVGGSTFYRASSIPLLATALNNPASGADASITDSLSDAALSLMPELYTTGGVLPSEIPPSAAHVAAIQNRIWLSSTDDDTIWISNEIVDGEAPTFSGSITIAPFEGGRVVGVAQINDSKIILKGTSVYVITGDGPGIDGLNGSFSNPQRLNTEVGCIDARSIVTSTLGVLFLSQNGLALIGQDLTVNLVGTSIQDTVGTSGVVSAALVPDQGLVRFAMVSASVCQTVEFDTFHGGVWGSSVYTSPGGSGTETIVGATYCRGSWFYLNSAGLLFQETKASWLDANGATTAYVPSRARLAYLSLAGIQGYQRVWWVSADMTRFDAHDLTIKIYVDDARSTTQTKTWSDAVASLWPRYQAQMHVTHQECEALSVEVSDAAPTGGGTVTTGQGFSLFGVSAELGIDRGLRRAQAAQSG